MPSRRARRLPEGKSPRRPLPTDPSMPPELDSAVSNALIALVSCSLDLGESCRARAETTGSLDEALQLRPDAIVADLASLPGLLASIPARLPWVAIIPAGDNVAAATASSLGAAAILERGVSSTLAALTLESVIAQSRRENELSRARRKLQLLKGEHTVGFWELDLTSGEFWCNPEAKQLLELVEDEGAPTLAAWIAKLPESEQVRAAAWIERASRGDTEEALEYSLPSGRRMRHIARPAQDPRARIERVTGMVEEVQATSPRLLQAQQVPAREELASSEFTHQVERAIRIAARTGQHAAVLHIDVHRVSALAANALSADAGDALLDAIAQRIREATRDSDTLGRGTTEREACVIARAGEHFTVLLPDLARIHDAAKVGTRILEALARPFEVSGHELCVPASIGIAGYPTDHNQADELVRRAETASFCARQSGNGALKFYSSELDARAFERLTLETSLRRALERNELCLYYQPRVAVNGEAIVGFEALLRWKHPDLGFVSPAQFIPLAEETGLIVPIGEWVLREACRQAKAWQDAGAKPVRMAVNLSTVQFTQPNLPQIVRDALAASQLGAEWLELELTESTVMRDAGAAVETLGRLKSAGVHLSIDDFGTGYSSLAYLKRFPIDALKIDQSFIRESTTNPDDAAIVTSILLMAKSLKLGVVAEGVETQSQLAFLRVLQCDEVQGYLFSPPVPPDKALALLENGFGTARAA